MSTALKAGVVTPSTLVNTNPGYMALNSRYTVRDVPRNNGVLTVTGVITKSSNIGSIKIAEKLPNDYFYESIHSFGYGQKPGSGFPGESAGMLAPPDRWNGLQKATMSYGYGLAVTPLQIARAYSALGNGGRLVTPTFVKGQRSEAPQVLDPAIAREVVGMMETVVTQGGAKRAGVLGYRVAGKTGTARIASGGGYAKGRYASFFAGLVPASNPRFAAVVVITDSQEGGYFGGLVAAPVFHDVMEGALRLMDVPPDDIEAWLAAQAKNAGKPGAAAQAPVPTPIADDAVDTTDPSAFDAPHATLPATGATR